MIKTRDILYINKDHVCYFCDGTGLYSNNFLFEHGNRTKCPACNGKGHFNKDFVLKVVKRK